MPRFGVYHMIRISLSYWCSRQALWLVASFDQSGNSKKAPHFSKTEIAEKIKSIEADMIFDAHYKWNIVNLAEKHGDVIKERFWLA